jgi:hypothetical protein
MIRLWPRREQRGHRDWEIKVTTSARGPVLDITPELLNYLWGICERTNDGYIELLRMPGIRVWGRPAGHVEPDRSELLRGTAAQPPGLRSRM